MRTAALLFSLFLFTACTPSTLTPKNAEASKHYPGEATVLIAVDGSDDRKVRYLWLVTEEEPDGYEIYFHDEKKGHGFIEMKLPAPAHNLFLQEYSLTGMYGCSRGKAGYGRGSKHIAYIEPGKTYFLGTINTSMNTVYNEIPKSLRKEAKSRYGYTPHGEDLGREGNFRSRLQL